jgi:hypothetical protein
MILSGKPQRTQLIESDLQNRTTDRPAQPASSALQAEPARCLAEFILSAVEGLDMTDELFML